MKLKYTAALAAFALCGTMSAQDIYKVETLTGSDLNGTARFVGMGGAMSTLGADLSVMGSNPAGIGMYRRSDIALTGSVTNQPNGKAFADIDKARGSFDQAGFVYAINMGKNSKLKYVNFGFNYQKRRNLKSFIGLNNIATANGASQSWQFQELAGTLDLSQNSVQTNPSAITAYDAGLISPKKNVSGEITGYDASNALAYNYNRAQWGGIQQYDFNFSFNVDNRIYVGATFGVYNVDIHNHLEYDENLQDNTGATAAYNMDYDEALTGTGFDVKAGIIFRPLESSPFRIGLSVSTYILRPYAECLPQNELAVCLYRQSGQHIRPHCGRLFRQRLRLPHPHTVEAQHRPRYHREQLSCPRCRVRDQSLHGSSSALPRLWS